VTENEDIKLGDLGSRKSLQVSSRNNLISQSSEDLNRQGDDEPLNKNFLASIKYTSPEVWEGEYSYATDNWLFRYFVKNQYIFKQLLMEVIIIIGH
jgi:serine/threonine protein kinase